MKTGLLNFQKYLSGWCPVVALSGPLKYLYNRNDQNLYIRALFTTSQDFVNVHQHTTKHEQNFLSLYSGQKGRRIWQCKEKNSYFCKYTVTVLLIATKNFLGKYFSLLVSNSLNPLMLSLHLKCIFFLFLCVVYILNIYYVIYLESAICQRWILYLRHTEKLNMNHHD